MSIYSDLLACVTLITSTYSMWSASCRKGIISPFCRALYLLFSVSSRTIALTSPARNASYKVGALTRSSLLLAPSLFVKALATLMFIFLAFFATSFTSALSFNALVLAATTSLSSSIFSKDCILVSCTTCAFSPPSSFTSLAE